MAIGVPLRRLLETRRNSRSGPFEASRDVRRSAAVGGKADVARTSRFGSN